MRDGGCPGCSPARAGRRPARRGVELDQLEPSVAVRGLHHRALRPDALEPHHAVHPTVLDLPFALQFESELDEERRRGREVVDHDAHVLQALDRHALDGRDTTAPARPRRPSRFTRQPHLRSEHHPTCPGKRCRCLVRCGGLVSRLVDSLAVAGDRFEDLLGGFGPDVGSWVLVPVLDPGADVGVEGADAGCVPRRSSLVVSSPTSARRG